MGSAVPRHTGYDEAAAILNDLRDAAEKAAERGDDPDFCELLDLYDEQLSACRQPRFVRLFIIAYLVRCVTGNTPDHERWEPLL
jgi:hypothetical protein